MHVAGRGGGTTPNTGPGASPLTFTLCPGQGLSLPPQQAAQSVTQTAQQVLGKAKVGAVLCVGCCPSLLGAGDPLFLLVFLLPPLPCQRQSGEKVGEGEEGVARAEERGEERLRPMDSPMYLL